MSKENIVVGMEIGTTKVCVAVADLEIRRFTEGAWLWPIPFPGRAQG